jgi:hypothetical protein
MWFDCLQITSFPSKRTSKLCAHAHHSDRSVAAAVFANGTYFVDTFIFGCMVLMFMSHAVFCCHVMRVATVSVVSAFRSYWFVNLLVRTDV